MPTVLQLLIYISVVGKVLEQAGSFRSIGLTHSAGNDRTAGSSSSPYHQAMLLQGVLGVLQQDPNYILPLAVMLVAYSACNAYMMSWQSPSGLVMTTGHPSTAPLSLATGHEFFVVTFLLIAWLDQLYHMYMRPCTFSGVLNPNRPVWQEAESTRTSLPSTNGLPLSTSGSTASDAPPCTTAHPAAVLKTMRQAKAAIRSTIKVAAVSICSALYMGLYAWQEHQTNRHQSVTAPGTIQLGWQHL